MEIVARWHTRAPAATPPKKDGPDYSLPKNMASIHAPSDIPLYKWMKENNVPALTMQLIDTRLTTTLQQIRHKPWRDPYDLRAQYGNVYAPAVPDPSMSIYVVMARLFTLIDVSIIDPQLYFDLGVAGSQESGDETLFDPRMWMAGLNDRDPLRQYVVWDSAHVPSNMDLSEPTSAYGVVLLQRYGVILDARMACCSERVGQTDGCWMTLDKQTPVDEPVLYQVGSQSRWANMAAGTPVDASFLRDDIVVGTAFKDPAKHWALHLEIKALWTKFVDTHLGAVYERIADTFDDMLTDAMPTIGPGVRLAETHITGDAARLLRSVLSLVFKYNMPQIGMSVLPYDLDGWIDTHILHVNEFRAAWTYDARGGKVIDGVRIRFLRTTRVERSGELLAWLNTVKKVLPNLYKTVENYVYRPVLSLEGLRDEYDDKLYDAVASASAYGIDTSDVDSVRRKFDYAEQEILQTQRDCNARLKGPYPNQKETGLKTPVFPSSKKIDDVLADLNNKVDAARKEAERRAREEAARKEAERRAREEADRKAKEDAERRAIEDAQRKAKEDAERRAVEDAQRKAKEEAERRAADEAARRAALQVTHLQVDPNDNRVTASDMMKKRDSLEALFTLAATKASGMPLEMQKAACLDDDFDVGSVILRGLSSERQEGLLHAWWAIANDRKDRIVIGLARADNPGEDPTMPGLELADEDDASSNAPGKLIDGLPKEEGSLELAKLPAKWQPSFEPAVEKIITPETQKWLRHAYWGAMQDPPNEQAIIRGLARSDSG